MTRNRTVVYNDPLCTDPVIDQISYIKEEDAIRWMKHSFPDRNYTDEDALHDFMVVHWAWFLDD